MATFLARLATSANRIGDRLRALEEKRRLDFVRKVCAEADVCFCVWNDERKGEGVAAKVIKGQRLLDDATADKGPSMRVVALPCVDEKHAAEISESFGGELLPRR